MGQSGMLRIGAMYFDCLLTTFGATSTRLTFGSFSAWHLRSIHFTLGPKVNRYNNQHTEQTMTHLTQERYCSADILDTSPT
jgi:hypothetical protein